MVPQKWYKLPRDEREAKLISMLHEYARQIKTLQRAAQLKRVGERGRERRPEKAHAPARPPSLAAATSSAAAA